jgi:hypothetical protein
MALAVSVIAIPAARAGNGLYVAESFGAGAGRGPLEGVVGGALHVRIGLGMRFGNFAVEPWIASDLQTDRNGGFKGLIGGTPSDGSADIELKGIDAKYIIPLDSHIDVFVRGGPLLADGNGALAGYHGSGVGVAGGAQLTGRVRALGFLWAPLFFVKRGPMVTGALFLDAGYDATYLRMAGARALNAGIAHVSIGFAVGTGF